MADTATAATGQLTEPTADRPADAASDIVNGAVTQAISTQRAADRRSRVSPTRVAALGGLGVVVVLAGLAGWLGFRADQSRTVQEQRALFLQVGKQTAVNLTTIDWQNADTDVKRIMDGATGQFRDDFASRSQPFIQVVKQSKSTTVGTVTEAGLESVTPDGAQVLVAVTVKTSNSAGPQQEPRSWRMRIAVQQVDGQAKVSNVEFVP